MRLKFAISLFLVFAQATFASENECNSENICVGQQYYETFYLDGPHLVTVLAIQPDGKLIVRKDEYGHEVTDNWKSSQLARTSGCNSENICVGEQYYESFYWDGPHVVTVVGIQSDGNPVVRIRRGDVTKRIKTKHLTKIPKNDVP
ncbi:hypothetical protein [Bdellovibrio sp. HCB337]|uniref:hypothetical protein n=1 Tax=Bdellovibrio sp. HCB337 TaxID=3394358 RepID=UPI0039A5709C